MTFSPSSSFRLRPRNQPRSPLPRLIVLTNSEQVSSQRSKCLSNHVLEILLSDSGNRSGRDSDTFEPGLPAPHNSRRRPRGPQDPGLDSYGAGNAHHVPRRLIGVPIKIRKAPKFAQTESRTFQKKLEFQREEVSHPMRFFDG